jgi:hypothetical protein
VVLKLIVSVSPEIENRLLIFFPMSPGNKANVGTALGFMRGREHDITLRGAFLHMMGLGRIF